MNILILGSGGREHTFAWKIRQSPLCDQLFIAPGNAGTAGIGKNVSILVTDFPGIADFALANQIELLVVGPEEPLVRGIRNYFASRKNLSTIAIIGPDQAGARLEGSKDFAKDFMQKYAIPTASSRTFTAENIEQGLSYLESHSLPVVLKADGLAAGKGVIIAPTIAEAQDTLRDMLVGQKFGEASAKVVIEQYLDGIELSVFVLTDGRHYVVLPEAKDYKRIGEGDTGPNTGGMGAVSPVPFADEIFKQKVEEKIIKPTIQGLQREGIQYVGFIFLGLMNVQGEPYVIEYNVRMGDPETEVVIPRLKSDLVELLVATARGELHQHQLVVNEQAAATVMLVSGGYPDKYEKGKVISSLEQVLDVVVFHAGTKLSGSGAVLTDGGRVMALTGVGETLPEALDKANAAAQVIQWENKYYRRDIGKDVLSKLVNSK